MKFDDDTVDALFGAEDAESESPERLKQYFVYNKAYESISSKGPLKIVVGHKGVGKSALLRRAYLDDLEQSRLSVWLQPTDFSEINDEVVGFNFNRRVEQWKNGILKIISRKALDSIGYFEDHQIDRSFTSDLIKSLRSIFSDLKPKLSDAVNFAILDNFLKDEIINIYIDDLDRGWAPSFESIQNISAFLNAARDLTNQNRNFRCRVSLRTDVYYLSRTSDESTDKVETNIVSLSWVNHDILTLIAHRIQTYFGNPIDLDKLEKYTQKDISDKILFRVIEPTFIGRGHWASRPIHNVLLSLCRGRPRDLVKLLHGAAKKAYSNNHSIISSNDLDTSFPKYSEERLQDLINEFSSEMPTIEKVLLNFRPTVKDIRAASAFLYSTDAIFKKIKQIRQNVSIQFTNKTLVTDRDVINFLYKIDFITARIQKENGMIERHYFDQNRFLSNDAVDFGFQWEIHPAYRWALQPNDINSVFDSMKDH